GLTSVQADTAGRFMSTRPSNPFTYGTETSLNTGFTLFPNFQANGTVSVGGPASTTDGTLANYYISQAISGPSVGEVTRPTRSWGVQASTVAAAARPRQIAASSRHSAWR